MQNKHNFVKLAENQKGQGTLYCGGLDPHLFKGYDENMRIYGSAMKHFDAEEQHQTTEYYKTLVKATDMYDFSAQERLANILTAVEYHIKWVVDILVHKCNIRVFKPQAAFYEQFGPAGLYLQQRIRRYIRKQEEIADIGTTCLLDCKRGDISTTQEAYFRALIGNLNDTIGVDYAAYDFDIINVTPWMGRDVLVLGTKENPGLGLKLMQEGKGLIIVNKSSNLFGPEYQEEMLQKHGMTLQMKNVADLYQISQELDLEYEGLSAIGIVVGSTHVCDGSIRKAFPSTTKLVPGFGAQGGKFDKIMAELIPEGKWAGHGAIFSSSRGTMFPFMTKYGGSGHVENLESDLIVAIEGFRKAEKKAYEAAGMYYPFAT